MGIMKKVLKRVVIVVLVIYLVVTTVLLAGYMIESTIEEQQEEVKQSSESVQASKEPQITDIDRVVLLEETNKHRVANGLKPLIENPHLNASAQDKCNDMVVQNYWSHEDPQGKEPWRFIEKYVRYQEAGENQAFGFNHAGGFVNGWKISPTHNANLLKTKYTDVGYGICKSENLVGKGTQLIVVQHFIAK